MLQAQPPMSSPTKPLSLAELLDGYTLRRLPNLASKRRLDSKRLRVEHCFGASALNKLATSEDTRWQLLAAASRLMSAYADADDVLVGVETREGRLRIARVRARRDGNSTLTRSEYQEELRRGLDQRSHSWTVEEVLRATREKDLNLGEGESPTLFCLCEGPHHADLVPHGVYLEPFEEGLRFIGEAATMSQDAAQLLLVQLETIFTHWKADASPIMGPSNTALGDFASLPNVAPHTLSAFAPPCDARREHLADEWLARNARERPEAVAHEIYDEPEDEPRLLTYAQLHEESGKLARWLREESGGGVKDEDRIAVCRRRDEGFYIAMAAILKAGCCYVPIDVDLPLERKRYIAEDSSALLVLTDADHVAEKQFEEVRVIDFDEGPWHGYAAAEFESHASMDGLAYILYTSGTTGKPKGCMQLHRGLFWAIDAIVEMPRSITDADKDKRLALAAVAFDVHISEIVQCWALGLRLVSVSSRLSLLASLQETVERLGITHVGMVPSMIEATLTKSPDELPIKYMVSGGEKCSDAVLSKWAANPKVLFANFYGPTEATIGCTARRVDGPKDRHDNIGLAFPGTSAYVVDDRLRILPRGTPGELIIEGALVGRGYVNLPDATAKAFLEWPEEGRRAYRTGDLVRMAPDGSIIIMGRIDSQIKLRGVRIESEGVSAVIRGSTSDSLPLDAVTAVCTHPSLGQAEVLVTFVAPKDGGFSPTERRSAPSLSKLPDDLPARLKEGARRGLASYMRPAHIIPCRFLPLSHNGKVDVKPLQALFRETSMDELSAVQTSDDDTKKSSSRPAAPLNDAEKKLVAIIEEVLSRPLRVGPEHTLIEAGMGSLDMTRLAARLSREGGRRVRAHDLFAAGTIGECAKLLVTDGSPTESNSEGIDLAAFDRRHRGEVEAALRIVDVQRVLPPLPVQPGILFSVLQDPSRYVQHFLYEVAEGVSSDEVRSALDEATRRHDMLRAGFHLPEDGSGPTLVVRGYVKAPLEEVKGDGADVEILAQRFKDEQAAEVAKRIHSRIHLGPLWNAQFRPGGTRSPSFLAVSLSHLVYDHGAIVSLMRGVDEALREIAPAPTATLSDVVSYLGDPKAPEHRQFWSQFLAPLKKKSRTALPPATGKHVKIRHSVRSSLVGTTAATAKQVLTMQALLNAAFALASAEHLEWRGNAVFGNIRSGRGLAVEGSERAVCPLVTVVPMLLSLEDAKGKKPASLCREAQEALVATLPHEHVPLGLIQQWTGQRNLIDCVVSCRHARKGGYYKLKHVPSEAPEPEFPLALELLLDEEADAMIMTASAAQSLHAAVEKLLPGIEAWMERLLQGGAAVAPPSPSESVIGDATHDSSDVEVPRAPPRAPLHITAAVLDEVRKLLSGGDGQGNVVSMTPTTSLVSLGMASLKAVALSKRLAKRGLKVGALDIIAADTAVGVAAVARCDEDQGDEPSLDASSSSGPCTPLQAGMLSQTVASEGALYVHAFVLRLDDGLAMDTVREAWLKALASLDILRTAFSFSDDDGEWRQEVLRVEDVQLPWRNGVLTSSSPKAMAKAATEALALREVRSLSSPPWALFPVVDDSVLVLAMHHALYDGVSLDTLLGHVADALDGEIIPPPPFLPIARQIASQSDAGVRFFADRLKGAALPARLVGQELGENPSLRTWRSSRQLDSDLSADLVSLACSSKVSVQSIAQLSLSQALAQHVSSPDIIFCQVMSGRTIDGAVDVVGPTFNTIPVRVRLDRRISHRHALATIHRDNNAALHFQHAPLRDVQRLLGAAPFADVLFVFQPNLGNEGGRRRPWTQLKTSDPDQGSGTHFALNVEVHEKEGGIAIFTSASAAVLNQEQLDSLVASMAKALEDIVASPDAPCTDLEGVAPENGGIKSDADAQPASDVSLTDKQQRFLALIAETLGVSPKDVKLGSSPAAIGLDSITAIRLSSRARSQLDVRISPSAIFKSSSVLQVLEKVAGPQGKGEDRARFTLNLSVLQLPGDVEAAVRKAVDEDLLEDLKILRCSGGMDLIYSMWQSSGGINSQMALIRQAHQRLDVANLHKAWESLLSHHAVLRSFILPTGRDEPRTALCIAAPGRGGQRFEEVELTGQDEVKEAQKLARQLLLSPLSVRRPASRLVLARGTQSDFVILNLPHIHYDAGSIPLLLSDLEALYRGDSPRSNADLEGFQAAAIGDNESNAARRKYWTEQLGDKVKPLELPSSRRPSSVPFMVRHEVTSSLADIAAVASRSQVSTGSLLLATSAWAQAESASSTSTTFGLVKGGRSSGPFDLTNLAAPTINVVPLRVQLQEGEEGGKGSGVSGLLKTAASIDATSREQPDDADHTRLCDIARWTGHGGRRLFDVSINLLLGGADGKEARRNDFWKPIKVPYDFTQEEQQGHAAAVVAASAPAPCPTFPEHDVDIELAIREVRDEEKEGTSTSRLRIMAEVAGGRREEREVRRVLERVDELLGKVVAANGEVSS